MDRASVEPVRTEPASDHIQSFPQPGAKQQISTKGGYQPRWSRDGKELFYLAPDATLMAVSIKSAGPSLEAGVPAALFKAPIHPRRISPPPQRCCRRQSPSSSTGPQA